MPVSRRRPCPLGGACGTPQWLLIAFHNGNRSITPPSIQWADVRWPPWHERALVTIFLLPHLFSLLHLKRCTGLAKLQSGHQSFNCIEFNLFIFQFYPLKIDFLCFFLSNLILILIPNYFYTHQNYVFLFILAVQINYKHATIVFLLVKQVYVGLFKKMNRDNQVKK